MNSKKRTVPTAKVRLQKLATNLAAGKPAHPTGEDGLPFGVNFGEGTSNEKRAAAIQTAKAAAAPIGPARICQVAAVAGQSMTHEEAARSGDQRQAAASISQDTAAE